METESTARSSRPRPWLLLLLGVALLGFLFTRMWSGGAPAAPTRSQTQTRAGTDQDGPIDPAELDVRLEALDASRPGQGAMERNPFRFQPKAPPPNASGPAQPYVPPPPLPEQKLNAPQTPPIPLKLMGFVTLPGGQTVAALSDCKGATFHGAEGGIVDGQYRIVKIGIESIQIEYVNGKGRQTLRVDGCEPR